MSGIKENENITNVSTVTAVPFYSIGSINPVDSENEYAQLIGKANTLQSPIMLRAALSVNIAAYSTSTLGEVKKQMIRTLNQSLTQIAVGNPEAVKQINQQIITLENCNSVVEAGQLYTQLTDACIREHKVVFLNSVSATVNKVMKEVGFATIVVKQISGTPLIIAKNSIGQTIRTEISESLADGKIDLVRIQSGIPESDCASLNQRINEGFIKNGLNFTRFNIIEKERNPQYRTFDFSENSDVCNNPVNQQLKSNL